MKTNRISLIVLCVLCFGPVDGFAQITQDEALSEFVAAGIAYKEGRYDAAIGRYRKILDGGRSSGPIYYNLGNSYFKKRNFGKAILNYERARRLIPRDSDLNFNYNHVQARIDQYGSDETSHFMDRAVKNFTQFYTVDEIVIIVVGFVMLVGALFLITQYVRWPQSLRNGLIALFVTGFLIFGGGLIAKVNQQRNLAVIMKKTESYFEPRTDTTVHYKLSEGMKVRILKSELNWVKIERFDGKVGWVNQEVLEKI